MSQDQPASTLISPRIAELGGWRSETLARMRRLIQEAGAQVVEEGKWRGRANLVARRDHLTGGSYKTVVKLAFAKAAALEDCHACSIPA